MSVCSWGWLLMPIASAQSGRRRAPSPISSHPRDCTTEKNPRIAETPNTLGMRHVMGFDDTKVLS